MFMEFYAHQLVNNYKNYKLNACSLVVHHIVFIDVHHIVLNEVFILKFLHSHYVDQTVFITHTKIQKSHSFCKQMMNVQFFSSNGWMFSSVGKMRHEKFLSRWNFKNMIIRFANKYATQLLLPQLLLKTILQFGNN